MRTRLRWVVGFGLLAGSIGGYAVEPLLAGADVSALTVFEQHGATYRDQKGPGDALVLLRKAGMDCFRLRLFVAPDGQGIVTNDLAYTLALARRVKASGAKLLLDLHYSDTWADPSKQFKPAAWAAMPFDELVRSVGDYTREVLARFSREGLTPDFVQIGNEITNGILWPDGRVEFAEAKNPAAWDRLARLLRAGIEAVPTGPGQPQVILHIESTNSVEKSLWFFRQAQAAGLRWDIIGVSYYPDWHGNIASLRATVNALAESFQKPVLVVETSYPWKPDEHWQGRPNMAWALTPTGQEQFLREVRDVVRAVPGGLGRGVIYWHPESIQVPGLTVWVGGSCALFDDHGRLLPAAQFDHFARQ